MLKIIISGRSGDKSFLSGCTYSAEQKIYSFIEY